MKSNQMVLLLTLTMKEEITGQSSPVVFTVVQI